MARLAEFEEIIKRNEPLAPYTYLKLGGPAEMLVQPRSHEELSAVVQRCFQERIPLRVLGSGCNLLVRDEGVAGVVLRLSEPAFTEIVVEGKRARAGTGAAVSALISQTARHGLAGLETLVGIPGTVGGALRTNAGDRSRRHRPVRPPRRGAGQPRRHPGARARRTAVRRTRQQPRRSGAADRRVRPGERRPRRHRQADAQGVDHRARRRSRRASSRPAASSRTRAASAPRP